MRNTLSKAGGKKKKVGHLFSGSPTDGNTGLKPSVSTKVERGQRVSFMLNPNHLKWIHQTATRSGINSSQLLDQVIEFSRNYSQNLEQGFQSGAAWTSEKFAIQISFERIAAFCRRQ